ncbi:hypothetical protein H2199_003956 [Coniosporium tulheliwenetii]|uniref:Uncharacterized protein n=1 Tax=Coniosporium tulheliwenetii TaxID=3383036 RepID=A0ACC2Z9W2_9PEZI|nr:hypothetical protein H2199_003956 [Cladosporium sp. JES 115]
MPKASSVRFAQKGTASTPYQDPRARPASYNRDHVAMRSNWTFIGEFFARVQAADTRAHAAEAREQQALAANRSLKFHLEQAMHKIHRYEKREIDGGRQQVIEYQMQMGKIRPINTSPPCVSSAVDKAPEEHQSVVESTETDAEVALENGGDRDTA